MILDCFLWHLVVFLCFRCVYSSSDHNLNNSGCSTTHPPMLTTARPPTARDAGTLLLIDDNQSASDQSRQLQTNSSADCYFKVWRIRWMPYSTDMSNIPVLTNVYVAELSSAGSSGAKIDGANITIAGRNFPNVWTYPDYGIDTESQTGFVDPELNPIHMTYTSAIRGGSVCFEFGRANPSTTVAVDAAQDEVSPVWKVRIRQTGIFDLPGPNFNAACLETIDQVNSAAGCLEDVASDVPSVGYKSVPPKNFQILEDANSAGSFSPFPCAEYDACGINGSCYDYGVGPLCAQCASMVRDGAKSDGTRSRPGELCGECPEHWVPWVKFVSWYLLWWAFVSGVLFIQYRATRAPLFSPAAQAEAKQKERDAAKFRNELRKNEALLKTGQVPKELQLDFSAEKDAQEEMTTSLSPILAAGLIRQMMEHHVLCSLAWEFSGFAICWPKTIREITFPLNMDWWNMLGLGCIAETFFLDDMLWYSLAACFIHWLIWSVGSFAVFKDVFGCTRTPEQSLLLDRDALEEAFARVDRDVDGKLSMEEILKAISPPEALKRMPGAVPCTLASFILWNFFQAPLYTRVWLYNLDCAKLAGKDVLRQDLRVGCSGTEENIRAYVSTACLFIFSIFPPLLSLGLIAKARKDTRASQDEDGSVTHDSESAYAFMNAGLHTKFWWFSSWKMLLKEILPIMMVVNRYGAIPQDPGAGEAPQILAIVGVIIGFIHDHLHPFDYNYATVLGAVERMSWIAFCTAPLAKLIIGNRQEVAVIGGGAYIGSWTKEATTWFHYALLFLGLITYFAPFVAGAYYIAGEEFGFTRVHTIHLEVAERVHVTLPPKGRERRHLVKTLAKLFEHALLSSARQAVEEEMPTFCPASVIEGALLVVMREDAAYWGDVQAGAHAKLEVEHESMLWSIGLFQRDREKRDMRLVRTIVDAGGLAETCLRQGFDINGLKVNYGDEGDDPVLGVKTNADGYAALGNGSNNGGAGGRDEIVVEATMIFFTFFLERAELSSLGFIEGKRKTDDVNQVRPGILSAIQRGIAVSVACAETVLDVRVHPIGVDRCLVTVIISCDNEGEMQIREEWLRTSLGTLAARNRWCKGMEADLARVGAVGSEGRSMMVRFNKTSRPQRTTKDGAIRLMNQAIRDAGRGAQRDKVKEEPQAEEVGKRLNLNLDADHDLFDPYDNDGLGLLQLAATNEDETTIPVTNAQPKRKGKGRSNKTTSDFAGGDESDHPRKGKSKKGKGKGNRNVQSMGAV